MSGPERTHAKPDGVRASSGPVRSEKARRRRRAFEATTDSVNFGSFIFGDLAVRSTAGDHLQTKLVVRGSDDHWEREADANADAVVKAVDGRAGPALRFTSVSSGSAPGSGAGEIQRQEEEEEEELLQAKSTGSRPKAVATETAEGIRALRGGGERLPAALRSEMEGRFGVDFGGVRVHAGPQAGDLAAGIGARAFTIGRDLVFAGGEYRPENREGKRLLAHELTHVVQQTRPALASVAGTVQCKTAAAPAVPRRVLDTALKGDDDEVRALTTSKLWPDLDLQPAESATLVEHLLDGATVTEDEQAGLEVLTKAWGQNRIDDTLEELGSRSRFGQLLDDYHGAEYRLLLSLLSHAIKKRRVKALYLDSFIAMWWLNKAEEEAVVILLEKSADAEVAALLKENNRLAELRSDIGDTGLAKRYEKKVGAGNVTDFDAVIKKLMAIFTVRAHAAKGAETMRGTRLSQSDVKRLLEGAGRDLGVELAHYKAEVAAAVEKEDAASVRSVNQRFEARIAALLKKKNVKIREFDLELKWNKEFDRALKKSFARNWTRSDLDELDGHLKAIPRQFLYGNENLREIRRGTTDPENPTYWGLASSTHVTLFKDLDPSVTTHEVGHFIHRDAPKIFEEFKKLSGWSLLTETQLRTSGFPAILIARLDEHRKGKMTYSFVTRNGYSYHYEERDNKKEPKKYWRCRAGAGFVSAYARTDPAEDFAETFRAYFLHHKRDRPKARRKFDFMHDEIFVKYWIRQEKEWAIAEFDRVGVGLQEKVKDPNLRSRLWELGGLPVRDALQKGLDSLATRTYEEAVKRRPRPKKPMEGWNEARTLGKGHLEVFIKVYGFAAEISRSFDKIKAKTRARDQVVQGDLRAAHLEILRGLELTFVDRLAELVRKPRALLLKGRDVRSKPWPELETVVRECDAGIGLTATYASYFQRFETTKQRWNISKFLPLDRFGDFDPLARRLMGRFPEGDFRYELLGKAIQDERVDLGKRFSALNREMLERLARGERYRGGALAEPKLLAAAYRSKIVGHYRRIKAIKIRKGNKPQWF